MKVWNVHVSGQFLGICYAYSEFGAIQAARWQYQIQEGAKVTVSPR